MAGGAWYVYIQTFFDQFDFVAKTPNKHDAERVAKVLRDRIKSESGCACLVRVQKIGERKATRNALDDEIARNLERGRRGEPAVEAFGARVAAELLTPPTAPHDANGSAPTAAAATHEHPALTLFHAMNALHTVCSNAGAFRELAQRRERARAMQLNFLNLRGKIASDRANELARAGAPMDQQWAALSEGMDRANDPPPSNEPAEYTKSLRENILDHGRAWCERARAAMRAGGAKGLDAATHPNAAGQARSIELHTKLQDAERVFVGLMIGVGDPRIIIDEDAASMADLGEWFARTRDELGAVFETRGLDAPAPTPTVSVPPDLLDLLQRAAVAVGPRAIDQAAEPAAGKIARVFGAGDNGHTKPPALPAGVALTTDHESILAVLGKTPTKCKTVIDVSSAGTIRNRETVGRLLGELARFGMVDRPHGKRKGYALTDAGRKRLPGATPT